MSGLSSYGKVYAIGHSAVALLFKNPVTVEEKIDGSQISFRRLESGELQIKSRTKMLEIGAPEKMFTKAVEVISGLDLIPGWIYRGEYLRMPKHNTLSYDRVPKNNIIIFDIDTGLESYLEEPARKIEADRIGLEVVPVITRGEISTAQELAGLLDTPSILGGQTVEGVVVKNYLRFTEGGHILKGKFVSEKFKEMNQKDWKRRHPTGGDIKAEIAAKICTEARWHKAVQHLGEEGVLMNAPQDIGPLLKRLHHDIEEECAEEIKTMLFAWAIKEIKRAASRGFPQWYKGELMKKQFAPEVSK